MNILFCSVGRRCELLKDFKRTLGDKVKIVATDVDDTAPALYFADKSYIVPRIDDENYLSTILDICRVEEIQTVTTLIDPEISVLAMHRSSFAEIGVEVLAPYDETANICLDKFKMYNYLQLKGIKTVRTYENLDSFTEDFDAKKIFFPVFVKPRKGSGSVGARIIDNYKDLTKACNDTPELIIQEYMNDCLDLDADVYVDTISHMPVAVFAKKKLSTKIGGANKTISFKDESLFKFIKEIVREFRFNGPIDMDFFFKDGVYYLSEINPRFGGAYLHAYGAGVDFVKLIENNINGIENKEDIGRYDDGVLMMMYDSVVIRKKCELVGSN